ncbi:hypothetical protein ACVGXY_15285, partial [Enterobacter intestinihominis]
DVQTQVVLRTRDKLALVEQGLRELESRIAPEVVKPAPDIPPVDDQALCGLLCPVAATPYRAYMNA